MTSLLCASNEISDHMISRISNLGMQTQGRQKAT